APLAGYGVIGRSAETMQSPGFRNRAAHCPPIEEISFPGAGGPRIEIAPVAGGGEIKSSASSDGIHSLGDGAVLERRLVGIAEVIYNDVAAVAAKVEDVLGEACRATRS